MSLVEFARFWAHVDIRGPNDCWEWTGSRNNDGYGVPDSGIQIAFREPVAHRVACALTRVRSDGDTDALHSCDNRACCNPRHLRWGTRDENLEDKRIAAWIRQASDARRDGTPIAIECVLEPAKAPKVLRRGLQRLDASQVRSIRADFAAGLTPREIANKYGVTQSHADSIAKGRIWRHVA